MKQLAIIVCFTLCLTRARAQPELRLIDFSAADSVAMKVKYRDDLGRLSKDLTTPFSNPVLKVRAIYKWVIENISFDYKFINKEKEIKWPDCSDNPNCKEITAAFEMDLAKKTASKKKATSDGYARLLKALCVSAGIPCEIVKGSVRTKPYQLGNNAPGNQVWNAVKLDTTWYFIDATLAAGNLKENEETGKLVAFKKKENDVYFLTPYNQFRKDHYPDKANWQALLGITSKEKFNRQPFFYDAPHYIKYLGDVSPDSGVLNAKVGDTLRISFSYPLTIDRIQVNSNVKQNPKIVQMNKQNKPEINMYALKRQVYWPYEKNGNTYTLKVPVTDRSLYYIDIMFKYPSGIDAVKVLRYRVNVPWANN